MNKGWFENIVKRYPKSYYECLYNFRDFYPESWKEKMQDVDEMMSYFLGHDLMVSIEVARGDRPGRGKSFRFRVSGVFAIESNNDFHTSEGAKAAALEFCFMVRDFVIRRREGDREGWQRIIGREILEKDW